MVNFGRLILNRVFIPFVLLIVYFAGIGLTRIFLLFSKSPLDQRADRDSYWRKADLGTGLDENSAVPREDRYYRQS